MSAFCKSLTSPYFLSASIIPAPFPCLHAFLPVNHARGCPLAPSSLPLPAHHARGCRPKVVDHEIVEGDVVGDLHIVHLHRALHYKPAWRQGGGKSGAEDGDWATLSFAGAPAGGGLSPPPNNEKCQWRHTTFLFWRCSDKLVGMGVWRIK